MVNNNIKSIAKTLLYGSVLVFILNFSHAQSWEVGPSAGFSNYRGDLAPALKLSNTRYSFGGNVKYGIDYFNGIRLNITSLNVVGSDSRVDFPLYKARGASFSANVVDFLLLYDYNFIPFAHPKELKNWSPYLTLGAGFHSAKIIGVDVEKLNPSSINVVIPMGVGTRIALNPKWVMNFEFLSRKTFTDSFDLVSDKYADNTQRGISTDTDWYFSLQGGISYTFYSVKCPDFYHEQ